MAQDPIFQNLEQVHTYGSPLGSRAKSLSEAMKGFRLGTSGPKTLQPNLERNGHTFFVRPQLNLSAKNCLRVRQLFRLLTDKVNSIPTFCRTTLDPRLYTAPNENCRTSLIDNDNPFIPILTNCCVSVSGWPDLTTPSWTSSEGMRREAYSIVDGVMENYEAFDLDVSFFNMQDEPISQLFYTWEKYATLVFEGKCHPYPDFIAFNEIDYNTRIYRLVMDKTDTYVSKIACCGIAYPISLPSGDYANFRQETPLEAKKDITIRFRCLGAVYYDDIALQEFNETVRQFNERLDTEVSEGMLGSKSSSFYQVPVEHRQAFSFLIPYIDVNTLELKWYADLSKPENKVAYDYLNKLKESEYYKPMQGVLADVQPKIINQTGAREVLV